MQRPAIRTIERTSPFLGGQTMDTLAIAGLVAAVIIISIVGFYVLKPER
jgi:hypothetical protein